MAEIRRLPVEGTVVFPIIIGFQHYPRWLGMGFQPSTVVSMGDLILKFNSEFSPENRRLTQKEAGSSSKHHFSGASC